MTFANETTHAAVKVHRCCACPGKIEIGTTYTRWTGLTDGDFQSVAYHVDCREAEVALNKRHGSDWDEWISLEEVTDEDFDWLCDEFPAVAARYGWSMFDWRTPQVGFWWPGKSDYHMRVPTLGLGDD